ncbi:MAG: hypothetical protein QOG09_428 [Solirubrobacterales bacterium]|nr:hypothetical protein [Solirubrobacterales bacterium]
MGVDSLRRRLLSMRRQNNALLDSRLIQRVEDRILRLAASVPGLGERAKSAAEISYWKRVWRQEGGSLSNSHYEKAFTTSFGLPRSYFDGKRMLDIGCGPRGSLEWADNAAERVGLDPLVSAYGRLGIGTHAMAYADAPSEEIPFPPGHFDIVSSFNSLDHVANLQETVAELTRVTKEGGDLLLITDVNHEPTPAEPISFSWDVLDEFTSRGWSVATEKHYEKSVANIYAAVSAAVPYDEANATDRYGVLLAQLTRTG